MSCGLECSGCGNIRSLQVSSWRKGATNKRKGGSTISWRDARATETSQSSRDLRGISSKGGEAPAEAEEAATNKDKGASPNSRRTAGAPAGAEGTATNKNMSKSAGSWRVAMAAAGSQSSSVLQAVSRRRMGATAGAEGGATIDGKGPEAKTIAATMKRKD
jgi:hypothetical protein